jgi:integrase
MATSRRDYGSGSIRNRGSDRRARWQVSWPVKVPTYRVTEADGSGERLFDRLEDAEGHQLLRRGRVLSQAGVRAGARSKTFPPGVTKRDAQAFLAERIKEQRSGRVGDPRLGETPMSVVFDRWLTANRRPGDATRNGYRLMIDRRINPAIGHIPIGQLRADDIARLLGRLEQPGADRRTVAYDKPLSATSVGHVRGAINACLRWAVRQHYRDWNPCENVDAPKRSTPEARWWEASHVEAFLAAVADDRDFALWRLAATTGMRRSELLGLRWTDVDLDAGTVRVTRRRIRVGPGWVDEPGTKTDKGRRTIAIAPADVAALRGWRARHVDERLPQGLGRIPDDAHVFVDHAGRPLSGSNVYRRFTRLVKRAGLPPIRFHDLRHSHGSILLAHGTPVLEVSRRLGHAKATMTLNVYAHVLDGRDGQAAATFEALIGGSSS